MKTKICFKCKREKSLKEFYKHNQMADGHLNKCKQCTKSDATNHRWNNIEKVRQYDRNRGNLSHRITARQTYQKTQRGIAALNRGRLAYIKRNPEKDAAATILNNRIRDGKIIKPKICSHCGKTERIHGHHEDYSKPLDVEWLCSKCHKQKHKKIRAVRK